MFPARHACPLLLLPFVAIAAAAQQPGTRPSADSPEFRKLVERMDVVQRRLQELNALGDPTPEQAHERDLLRAEFLQLTAAMAQRLAPAIDTAAEPDPERTLSTREQELAARALALARESDLPQRDDGAAGGGELTAKRVVLLDHPALLRALPSHRYYALELAPRSADDATGEPLRHTYYLLEFDVEADTARVHPRESRGTNAWNAAFAGARARTVAEVEDVFAAREVLANAERGATVFRPPDDDGRSHAALDRRFLLGRHADAAGAGPHRVIGSPNALHLVTWRLNADDFGLPAALHFDVLSFRESDGECLGARTEAAGSVPPNAKPDGEAVRAKLEAFCERLAKGDAREPR